jgi:hypothetical protein
MFVIRKIHSAYLVSGNEDEVKVEPLNKESCIAASSIICSTMQMVGFSKMVLNHPINPGKFLQDYYQKLGWSIENAA